MILAFTGAGISRASGIPTFAEQEGIRDKLSRSYARTHPDEFQKTISNMQGMCETAEPNDAHYALAEYDIPIITMNVDGLHQRAGSAHVLPVHGEFPNIVLYEDPAPRYQDAISWVQLLQKGDIFLIVGTSFYTQISEVLRISAKISGAGLSYINEDAEHKVREFLARHRYERGTFEEFMARADEL